jgi:predicted DNA-binding protein YlxM (UPF0122 family)
MFRKNLEMALYYDCYSQLLTERQQTVMRLYYEEDLSLGEIAEMSGISRQAVRDCLKRGEECFLETEKRLHVVEKYRRIKSLCSDIRQAAESGDRDRVKAAADRIESLI